MGSLALLQRIFPTQGWDPGLPHCGRILYQLSHKGSPTREEEFVKERAFQTRNMWGSYGGAGPVSNSRKRDRVDLGPRGDRVGWLEEEIILKQSRAGHQGPWVPGSTSGL